MIVILLLFVMPLNELTYSSSASNQIIVQKNSQSTISNVKQDYSTLLNMYINSLIKQGENISSNGMRCK